MIKYNSKNNTSTNQDFESFDDVLTNKWNKALEKDIFRYRLDDMKTRIVGSNQKYIIQLNEKRGTERRKPEYIDDLNLSFKSDSFNFTKVNKEEMLFSAIDSDNVIADSSILINVSPCETIHCLIVPEIHLKHNQVLTYNAIVLSLKVYELCQSKYIRMVFNSLCAFASVNHLHLHLWRVNHPLCAENSQKKLLTKHISLQFEHKCSGFIIHQSVDDIITFSRRIFEITNYLREINVAYNMFISKFFGCVDVYVWPRNHVTGIKNTSREELFNVAAFELAGHVPVFCSKRFENIKETDIDDKIEAVSLNPEKFKLITENILRISDSISTNVV